MSTLKKITILFMAVAMLTVWTSCNKDNGPQDPDDPGETATVKDIDGNVYKTVKIGNQVWMAENLNVTHYNDGEEIYNATAQATNPDSWIERGGGLRCYYDNEPNNGKIYGQLYNWDAVNSGKLAPKGWHIPTREEWDALAEFLGGPNEAGPKLKATTLWNEGGTHPGNNSSGFAALPAGQRSSTLASYAGKGVSAGFWSSTITGEFLFSYNLGLNYGMLGTFTSTPKRIGLSVRCIKD